MPPVAALGPGRYRLAMARDEGYRRYFEAAAAIGEITRARAEELVRELMSTGDNQRAHAQEWVDEVMERSRKAAGDLLDLVRTEVANQLQALGVDPDDLARQAADIMRRSADAGRRVMKDATSTGPATKAGGAKATAKKSTAKKSAAKKSAARKSAGTKKSVGTKKAAAKKAAAKKSAGAKKSPVKKSSAKKSSRSPGAS